MDGWEAGWVDTPIGTIDESSLMVPFGPIVPFDEFMEWLRTLAVQYAEDNGAELAEGPVWRVPATYEIHYIWPLLRRS